ncbi:DUF4144 family protein [Vibrio thalassae]|uniref:DUF4144 family protein n=1 Tax=Vibrio thalassae TaxID=1243014 RepID=UPI00361FA873
MVRWPCIFKLEGDPELMYFGSESALASELEFLIWSSSDRLIDSEGHSFTICQASGRYTFELNDSVLSLSENYSTYSRARVSNAEVCLTKIQFTSVEQAIQSLSFE